MLFNQIRSRESENITFNVEVSYLEIYNERVKDLLNPHNKGSLRIREHPLHGTYVEDLTKLVANSSDEIRMQIDLGNKSRTIASTNLNETSSRSHAVFTVTLTQVMVDDLSDMKSEKVSRISLVDLAGSESARLSGATGQRLKEGGSINKSLVTLGKVISALSVQTNTKKKAFVPYRDSALTWLLKDSLGGNSRTAMIATISPTEYDESLSTLRYAERAKNIVNEVTVNEDPNAKLIRELRKELDLLRSQLYQQNQSKPASDTSKVALLNEDATEFVKDGQIPENTSCHGSASNQSKLQEKISASEKLMKEVRMTWEEREKASKELQQTRNRELRDMGIDVQLNDTGDEVGIHIPKTLPHLVNLSEDALMSECLIYNIKPGVTTVGRIDSDMATDIKLSGPDIGHRHCTFENDDNGNVVVHPLGNVFVNGQLIRDPKPLRSGYRLIIGTSHVFRFSHPQEAKRLKQKEGLSPPVGPERPTTPIPSIEIGDRQIRPSSPPFDAESVVSSNHGPDYYYAMREMFDSNPQWSITQSIQKDSFAAIRSIPASPVPFLNLIKAGEVDSQSIQSGSIYGGESFIDGQSDIGSIGSAFGRLSPVSQGMASSQYFPRSPGRSRGNILSPHLVSSLKWSTNGFSGRNRSGSTPVPHLNSKPSKRTRLNEMVNHQRSGSVHSTRTLGSMFTPPPEAGFTDSRSLFGPFSGDYLTDRQIELARSVVKRWRKLRFVKLGKELLSNIVYLKEANILSKELGQKKIFQFAILNGGAQAYPSSPLEPDSLSILSENDDSEQLLGNLPPQLAIKLLDIKNRVIRALDLDEFQAMLEKMRRISAFRHQPGYMHHLSSDVTSLQDHGKYTPIGQCSLPIVTTGSAYTFSIKVPIFDILTFVQAGSIHGTLHFDPLNSPPTVALHLLKVDGLETGIYDSVHCKCIVPLPRKPKSQELSGQDTVQMYLKNKQNTTTLCSQPAPCVEENGQGCATLNLVHELEVPQNPPTSDITMTIQLFGHALPTFVRHAFQNDRILEKPHTAKPSNPKSFRFERLNEKEYFKESHHELIMWIGMLELDAKGHWPPISAERTGMQRVFPVHQGLQQRLTVTISHSTGHQLKIIQIESIRFARVCIVDKFGHSIKSPDRGQSSSCDSRSIFSGLSPLDFGHEEPPVDLYILASQDRVVDNQINGQQIVRTVASFDTTSHSSNYLTQITPQDQIVQLQLEIAVRLDRCTIPAIFVVPIHLKVYSRNASIGPAIKWFNITPNSSIKRKKRVRKSMTQTLIEAFHSLATSSKPTSPVTPTSASNQDMGQNHGTGGSQSPMAIDMSISGSTLLPASSLDNGHDQEGKFDISNYPEAQHGVTKIFTITIVPEDAERRDHLWRWNSQSQYVRGEETLFPWVPRSVSLIKAFHRWYYEQKWWLRVQKTRMQLLSGSYEVGSLSKVLENVSRSHAKEKAFYFLDAMKSFKRVPNNLPPLEEADTLSQTESLSPNIQQTNPADSSNLGSSLPLGLSVSSPGPGHYNQHQQLMAQSLSLSRYPHPGWMHHIKSITPIYPHGQSQHEGYLQIGDVANNQWEWRWMVIEKPYMYVYQTHHKLILQTLINLKSARAEYHENQDSNMSTAANLLCGRDNVFFVYTCMNSFAFQADSPQDCLKWISAIDEWHVLLPRSSSSSSSHTKPAPSMAEYNEAHMLPN
ncbi:hypothetical protein H4219_001315 [Mycoemilia scoparia]|uniref:Kinesin motor domain-containing protein n=1 Tax=Mycoemilia scoparia TaxID=417184 RepID=A0A9W8DW92_9FUNG|nr:hypothetical protein H4219_001315 [Mycoemilia scoparia]